jgi:hypothetical protein
MSTRFRLFLLLAWLAQGCGGNVSYPTIVEAKDVNFMENRNIGSADAPVIRLRGLVFHSALAVERFDLTQSGSDVSLIVHLTPARRGLSGSFHLDVPLPAADGRIHFGRDATVIWPKAGVSER